MDWQAFETDGYARAGTIALDPDLDPGPRPIRDVLAGPGPLRDLACSAVLGSRATAALCAPAFPVRATLFAKSSDSDWFVPWHRDRTVGVADRREAPGFDGWTVKDGIPHAIAPARVLRNMVALRVHLDPCPEEAGPLEVIPGSHRRLGTSPPDNAPSVVLTAQRGEVLAMRPLLWHRSRRLGGGSLRRVLHVEFAASPLPAPLRWHHAPSAPPGDQPPRCRYQ